MTNSQPLINVLVTGGCGFIGSNFIRQLYHTHPNYRIYNLDALTYAGNSENLTDIEKLEVGRNENERRYVFVRGDVADRELLRVLFEEHGFTYIFHFAAETHVDRSYSNLVDFIRTNVDGTIMLATMAMKFGGKMVHISTDEVYGSIPEEVGFVDEDAAFHPSNPYASSKAAADMLLQSFMRTYNAPINIVRATNNYGCFQYPEKLLPLAMTNLLEDVQIPIHGAGTHLRQWIHVEDFARAIDLVSLNAPTGAIYNVAGEHASNLEALSIIATYLGKNIDEYKYHTPDRPGADYRYAIDSSKLERELGWKRQHDFRLSILSVVDWYIANRPWWEKIRMKKEFTDNYKKQSQAKYS